MPIPVAQHPSNYPDQRSSIYQDRSNSIPIPGVQDRHDPSHDWDPSRVGGASWKGDGYSRQNMFNPYSSSSQHSADRVHPGSDEEESSDDSYSSNGSGSETAAPNPRSGKGAGSRGTYKTRSTAPSIPAPTLPPLDIYHGLSNPSGLSKSKSQQPWVAEPSGYKERESTRLPAQSTSNRQDTRGRGADTEFVVGSYRGEVGGGPSGLSISKTMSQQPATSSDSQSRSGLSISKAMSQQAWVGQSAASSDSQSRSGHKEEGARASGQSSSNRPDPLGRGVDTDFVVGSYRGEAGGGLSGLPTDYQSRSGNRDKESARSSGQPSSSRPDRRDRGADTEFVVGSYRGEPGGGISGHPSDSQSRSGNKEKESARSRREESRVRGTDEDYVAGGQGLVGGHRGEAGGGISGHPSDSQSRSSHKEKESTRLPMQPSSSRQHPRDRGADTEFGVGSYLGDAGGGISGHPSDSQSRSGNKEKESTRSRREESRVRGINEDYVAGGQGSVGGRGEAGGGISGHPSDSQSRSGYKEKESARLPMQPSSSRQDPRGKGADMDFVVGSYRGEAGGGISGHPSDSQSRSGNKEKESARSLGQPNSSRQEPRVRETDADYGTGGQGSVGGYRGEASAGASGQPQPWTGKPTPALAPSSTHQPSGRQPEYTSANRSPYAERENRSSIAMMGTTEHSSRPPPNPTTSISHRQEEDSPPYNTRGSGWGSSQPDPSRTTPYGAFSPTRPPQPAAQYQHPSQAQGSLGSQRPESTWDGGSSRPSGGRDLSSNPSAGATGSYPWGGQPTGALPGKSTHAPHCVYFSSISASKILTTIRSGFDRRLIHESNPSLLTVFFCLASLFS